MLFEPGFLGTRALMFMDMVTIYFAMMPFLVFMAIRFAIKGNYEAHYRTQAAVFVLTLIMVIIFEVGVRVKGGFTAYAQESSVSLTFMSIFLIIHIIIAIATVVGWAKLIINAGQSYRKDGREAGSFVTHKKAGRLVFLGICITSLMGCMIYGFLFLF